MTPAEMRAEIEKAPYPLEEPGIWKRGLPGEEGYELAARATARALLIVCDENPSLLDVPSREDDPSGIERAYANAHWEAAKERWPGLDDWLGGITLNIFGWANGAVRYILGAEAVGNPAIITIGVKE